MRKLLALFGAVGLVSMSAATVVSCNDVADLGYYADSIENNLRTENYVVGEDTVAQEILRWVIILTNQVDLTQRYQEMLR
jgi:hypothetical protein